MAKAKRSRKPKSTDVKPLIQINGIAIPEHIQIPGRLPKPGPGRNLTDTQKIKIAKVVCDLYATDMFALENILNFFHIKSWSTWSAWQREIKEIADLYKSASSEKENKYFHNLRIRAHTSLEKKVDGHFVNVITRKIRRLKKSDEEDFDLDDYTGQKLIVEEIIKQIYIPPSDSAIQYVLNNRDGSNFTKNPLPVAPESKETNISIQTWVKSQEEEDETNLD